MYPWSPHPCSPPPSQLLPNVRRYVECRTDQSEVLEGTALAIVQNCPEPHAQDVHCHCGEGRDPGVSLQHPITLQMAGLIKDLSIILRKRKCVFSANWPIYASIHLLHLNTGEENIAVYIDTYGVVTFSK